MGADYGSQRSEEVPVLQRFFREPPVADIVGGTLGVGLAKVLDTNRLVESCDAFVFLFFIGFIAQFAIVLGIAISEIEIVVI